MRGVVREREREGVSRLEGRGLRREGVGDDVI